VSDPQAAGQARVRASDAEREEVAAVLRTAIGEGRLTLAEGEQRLAGVYATTYRDELGGFTADLPSPPAGAGSATGAAPAGAGSPAGAGRRPGRPLGAVPVAGLATLGAVLTGIWAASTGGSLWPAILLGTLAVMLVKHGRHRAWPAAAAAPQCRPHR
jgi:hypothetical protein